MRNARVVGLSPDGMSLVVSTDGGEELAIAADDRLRAAVRGDRPRLGQLENEMETPLSPRDIQTRIRAGATLEDVARVAGLPMDRVERFAAPVLAERDHVAITAMSGSARRRGETSGHRNLRLTVTERLTARGVDVDTIAWDAYRLDDGRWTVTADYATAEQAEHAEFVYDPRGRFSIAGNDQGRWLLGEHPPAGPHSGDPADAEPTVDLSDELALVRATQEAEPTAGAPDPAAGHDEPTVAVVRALRPVPDAPVAESPTEVEEQVEDAEQAEDAEQVEDGASAGQVEDGAADGAGVEEESALQTLYEMLDRGSSDEDHAGPETGAGVTEVSITEVTVTEVQVTGVTITGDRAGAEPTPADLDAADWAAPDPRSERPRVTGGASDASAVPETTGAGAWEPAITVTFPLEPSRVEDGPADGPAPDAVQEPTDPATADRAGAETSAAVPPHPVQPVPERPVHPGPASDRAEVSDGEREFELETEVEAPPVRRPVKKKRASVPSWDEIMFGGPRPPSS